MGKQRCGSCRFFQDAGMAGSGWCHHPLRKTTNELLIMVRRNELACRDQWSHSLWEEGTWEPAPAAALDSVGDEPIVPGRPLLPATERDIAALLRADRAERPVLASALSQEDVVLGEARLVTDRTPPWRREDPPAEPRRDYDPRTAIKKAREAYRERMRAQEAARAALADAAPLAVEGNADAIAERLGVKDEPQAERDRIVADAVPEPDADPVGAVEAPMPLDVEPEPGVEAGFVAEPASPDAGVAGQEADPGAVDGDDLDADWWATGDAGPDAPFAEWADPEPFDESVPAEPVLSAAGTRDAAPSYREPAFNWFGDEAAPPLAASVASSPWSVASAAAVSSPAEMGDVADDWHGVDAWRGDDAAAEVVDAGEAAWDDRFDRQSAGARIDEFGGDPVAEPFPNAAEERAGQAAAVDAPPERPVIHLLPVGSVAPGVPRICRTCRDFRPGEAGERGWCANQWAFTTRQMVHPDDPAPCETSIGSWWLPTDDLCLADADVSTHGQPTPHLDRWLPHHRERVAERKRS